MADYDKIIYCDIVDACETCPRYGDDCDGYLEEGKTMSDLIKRSDAIDAVREILSGNVYWDYVCDAVNALSALPSAETSQNLAKPNKELIGSDLISRADAIEALCHNCAYYTDAQCKTDSGYWCESGAMIREDIPSADAPKPSGDLISRA